MDFSKWRCTHGSMCLVLTLILMAVVCGNSWAQEDIDHHQSCSYCGMDRAKFAHSRVYIEYDDGSTAGTCSLHCAALDMALHIDKGPVSIEVGDYQNKTLIDAETAVWVIGGSKMGVMTKRAKWAFGNQAAADAFMQQDGGQLSNFEEALKAAYADMYQDTKMIREKRKKMRKKMGHGS